MTTDNNRARGVLRLSVDGDYSTFSGWQLMKELHKRLGLWTRSEVFYSSSA